MEVNSLLESSVLAIVVPMPWEREGDRDDDCVTIKWAANVTQENVSSEINGTCFVFGEVALLIADQQAKLLAGVWPSLKRGTTCIKVAQVFT